MAKIAKRQLAFRLHDRTHSARLALDYDSSGKHVRHEYDDYFVTYSTASDLYKYDNLIFSGTYMLPPQTRALLSPRGIAAPPDPGIKNIQWADGWKTGDLFGSPIEYTYGSLYNYRTVNLRFTRTGVTVIVMSNSSETNPLAIAERAARFTFRATDSRSRPTPRTMTPRPNPRFKPPRSGNLVSLHGRNTQFNGGIGYGNWGIPKHMFVAPPAFRVSLKYACGQGSETLFAVSYRTNGVVHSVTLADTVSPLAKHPQRLQGQITRTVHSPTVNRWAFWLNGLTTCQWSSGRTLFDSTMNLTRVAFQ